MEMRYFEKDGQVFGYDENQSDLAEKILADGGVEITGSFPPKSSRDDAIAGRWLFIKAERDRRIDFGGYKVGDHWFHSDAKSRGQQRDNEAEGEGLTPIEWKTMSGEFVTMTPALATAIRAARMSSDSAIFAAAEAHAAAMAASDDPAAYDFSIGWPAAYGE